MAIGLISPIFIGQIRLKAVRSRGEQGTMRERVEPDFGKLTLKCLCKI
jgi:hypothetical protein